MTNEDIKKQLLERRKERVSLTKRYRESMEEEGLSSMFDILTKQGRHDFREGGFEAIAPTNENKEQYEQEKNMPLLERLKRKKKNKKSPKDVSYPDPTFDSEPGLDW